MNPIKVLVVDDSAFMRKMVSDILHVDNRIKVIATARNGYDALEKLTKYSPDVVTLDVEMPKMDGLTTLKMVMEQHPLPVVTLSSMTKEGADKTIQSFSLGAVDFITKPSGAISLDIKTIQQEIIAKVISASSSQIPARSTNKVAQSEALTVIKHSKKISERAIVAIGTSTGGPRALQQVLSHLPNDFPAPIVIVQHMPKGFTKSLAERLNGLSNISVKEAEDGDLLEKGTAYIAPGGTHLSVRQLGRSLAAKVSHGQPRNGHQPSVDVLFESLGEQSLYQVHAIVMTGMGSDGSKSLYALKKKRADTVVISESSKTAVVFGMPQAAVKTNLVDYIVNVDEISNVLLKLIKA